jgi:hypothetical protein
MEQCDAHLERSTPMARLRDRVLKSARTLTLALVFLALPPTLAHAQFIGYGGGLGYPGVGYGGLGYPGIGYGGLGYPGVGYGGLGYPGVGFGGLGYGFGGLGFAGYGFASGFPALAYSYQGFNPYGYAGFYPNYPSPMFGVGLTPLGVNSALTERYMLGRGLPARTVTPNGYGSSYYAPRANPR